MNPHHMHPYTHNKMTPHGPADTDQDFQADDGQNMKNEAPVQEERISESMAQEEPPLQEAEQCSPAEKAQAELEDMRLRMAAEMDNFKKRLTREHQEQMRYASEKVLSELLPALDNLDLALQYGSAHEACKDMMTGIEMTRKQLLEAVERNGLASVGETGEAFDPAVHEAIGVESNPELGPGAVSRVLQRGYKLNDRLLRPAKVMVNN